MKKFLKKSDKGFSLVELIVVIAIMAVLIGIIAPAFMKYVGKSKESAKAANLDELRKAANTVLADPELSDPKNLVVVISDQGVATYSGNNTTNFQTLLEDALGGENKYPKATEGNKYTITITASATGGYSAEVVEEPVK